MLWQRPTCIRPAAARSHRRHAPLGQRCSPSSSSTCRELLEPCRRFASQGLMLDNPASSAAQVSASIRFTYAGLPFASVCRRWVVPVGSLVRNLATVGSATVAGNVLGGCFGAGTTIDFWKMKPESSGVETSSYCSRASAIEKRTQNSKIIA